MILAALALSAGAPSHPASDFVAATQLCIAAAKDTGIDEAMLVGAGWVRVTTDAEEEARPIRTYAKIDAVLIHLPMRRATRRGCVIQADQPPEGGLVAVEAAFTQAYGVASRTLGSSRQWRLPAASILIAGDNRPFAISVIPNSGASE